MKYSRWLFMLVVTLLCLGLAVPMNAHAASKSAPNAETKSVKKSDRKVTSSKSKKGDKQAVAKASNKKSKKNSRSKNKRAAGTQVDNGDSREIWLKRAQDSELLTGVASWYGTKAHGGTTASGLSYDMYTFTAAHRTLPIGTVVRVTDQAVGKSVMVCITDRGPYIRGRVIDLSYAAANQLSIARKGVGNVDLEVVSDESGTPLKADQAYYVRYAAPKGSEHVGPFRAFADAAAMHEALRQAHPEAEMVLGASK